MEAFMEKRSSRVIPGLRGTPAGTSTTSAPSKAAPSSSAPECPVTYFPKKKLSIKKAQILFIFGYFDGSANVGQVHRHAHVCNIIQGQVVEHQGILGVIFEEGKRL